MIHALSRERGGLTGRFPPLLAELPERLAVAFAECQTRFVIDAGSVPGLIGGSESPR